MELSLIVEGTRVVRNQEPSFSSSYDIAVLGIGTAGAEALAESLLVSDRVIGIERSVGPGGLGTVGGVSYWSSIPDKLRDYERRCRAADIAYESVVIGVWSEKRRITGVRFCTRGKIRDVAVRVVIDATGNAAIARLLGLPVRKGRPFDGALAPLSRAESWQGINGVVNPRYANYFRDPTLTAREYSDIATFLSKERYANWCRSRATGRMLMPALMVAAREEYRVTTEEILTMRDQLTGREFADPVFRAFGPEDLPIGGLAYESEEIQNWKIICGLPLFGYPTTVTYGMLVAKGVENLFVPSKHFGVAHDLGGTLRMQGEMKKTGAVAAWAAGIALRRGCPAREVPYGELRPILERAGYLNPPEKTRVDSVKGFSFKMFSTVDVVRALHVDIRRTDEWWRASAKGGQDELAAYAYWTVWNCALRGTSSERQELADALTKAADSGGRYTGNYAVALGLMRDGRAKKYLRRIVLDRGGETSPLFENSIPNVTKAIILLGRFADIASLELLCEIIEDGARKIVADYHRAGVSRGEREDVRSALLSYVTISVKRILQNHPNEAVAQRIRLWQKNLPPSLTSLGEDRMASVRMIEI